MYFIRFSPITLCDMRDRTRTCMNYAQRLSAHIFVNVIRGTNNMTGLLQHRHFSCEPNILRTKSKRSEHTCLIWIELNVLRIKANIHVWFDLNESLIESNQLMWQKSETLQCSYLDSEVNENTPYLGNNPYLSSPHGLYHISWLPNMKSRVPSITCCENQPYPICKSSIAPY